jgi:CheY-like chemotaxis protein
VKKLKVLLVEDQSDCRLLIHLYLRHLDIILIQASKAREAFEILKSEEADIILMDIQMPEINGYEAVKFLRNSDYKKPIIALTAHAMTDEVEQCYEVGCNDVLTKPIRKQDLIKMLARHTSAKNLLANPILFP